MKITLMNKYDLDAIELASILEHLDYGLSVRTFIDRFGKRRHTLVVHVEQAKLFHTQAKYIQDAQADFDQAALDYKSCTKRHKIDVCLIDFDCNVRLKEVKDSKPKLANLSYKVLAKMAGVREYGATKYGSLDDYLNYSESDFINASLRHIYKSFDHKRDDESGMDHLAHALVSLMFAYEIYLNKGGDDETE